MNGEFWSIGECMLEIQDGGSDTLRITAADDTYSTAVYFKRMLPSVVVRYVSALGQDAVSQRMRQHICAHDVDDSLIAALPGRLSGCTLVRVGGCRVSRTRLPSGRPCCQS